MVELEYECGQYEEYLILQLTEDSKPLLWAYLPIPSLKRAASIL
jgi:hypothetical protein